MRAARASSSARSARSRSSVWRAFCRRSSAWVAITFKRGQFADGDVDLVRSGRASGRAARPRAPRPPPPPALVALQARHRLDQTLFVLGRSRGRSRARCGGQLLAPARRRRRLSSDHAIQVLLQPEQRHLVGAQAAAVSSSARDRSAAACLRSICRAKRALQIGVESLHHLFQLADLALLLEHAGQRRLARAARDHALRIDDLAFERDDGLGRCACRATTSARAPDPRRPARRRAGTTQPRRTAGRSRSSSSIGPRTPSPFGQAAATVAGSGMKPPPSAGVDAVPAAPTHRVVQHLAAPGMRAQGARDERRPTLARALEELDRLDARLVRVDDDVAQALAEHGLDGGLQLRRRLNDVGDDALDAVAAARRAVLLHDRADALLKALVAILDLASATRVATAGDAPPRAASPAPARRATARRARTARRASCSVAAPRAAVDLHGQRRRSRRAAPAPHRSGRRAARRPTPPRWRRPRRAPTDRPGAERRPPARPPVAPCSRRAAEISACAASSSRRASASAARRSSCSARLRLVIALARVGGRVDLGQPVARSPRCWRPGRRPARAAPRSPCGLRRPGPSARSPRRRGARRAACRAAPCSTARTARLSPTPTPSPPRSPPGDPRRRRPLPRSSVVLSV